MAFESLTEKLSLILKRLRGQSRLTEANMDAMLQEVRAALLEADVNLKVVREFLNKIKQDAVGQQVFGTLNPSQTLVKIVRERLIELLGAEASLLTFEKSGPTFMMVAGLQGTGKTTSVAKLAKLFKEKQQKKVLLVGADIYRPAAIDQLETLAKEVEVAFYSNRSTTKVLDIIDEAKKLAEQEKYDVVLIDTAGRLSIDERLMEELELIGKHVSLKETLLVVDAMSGQDAYNVAKIFHERLNLTGLIMTKLDGDARGGAALSIRHLTGLAIKVVGIGEKIDDLEMFYPERMADRILGMGDVVTLIEKAKENIDEKESKRAIDKMMSGRFDLNDMLSQMRQVQKLGSLGGVLKMLPGMPKISEEQQAAAEREMRNFEAIINSMTPEERHNPDILRNSRKMRIAKGSGKSSADINRVIKKYEQTREMMRMLGGSKGKMPGGMGGFPFGR
ncbi:MAG TPA: signal recognition particle protein [Firmicutes bacterium]|jgi:signal recognition particle subunit SRP54|nr:signal recognition particle protein [Bacillota bacterium]